MNNEADSSQTGTTEQSKMVLDTLTRLGNYLQAAILLNQEILVRLSRENTIHTQFDLVEARPGRLVNREELKAMEGGLMTLPDAARRLGVAPGVLKGLTREMIIEPKLEVISDSGKTTMLFHEDDVQSMIDNHVLEILGRKPLSPQTMPNSDSRSV